jgi:hypothetical protein
MSKGIASCTGVGACARASKLQTTIAAVQVSHNAQRFDMTFSPLLASLIDRRRHDAHPPSP